MLRIDSWISTVLPSQDTIFRIFSQSKPISTAAFLTLIDEVRGTREVSGDARNRRRVEERQKD